MTLYSAHEHDMLAPSALELMMDRIRAVAGDCETCCFTRARFQSMLLKGSEPPCAPGDSIFLFTCPEIHYPSTYLRILPMDNADKMRELIRFTPVYGRSAGQLVAINPNADFSKEKEFGEALLNLHRVQAGWKPPQVRKSKRITGWHARQNRSRPYLPL